VAKSTIPYFKPRVKKPKAPRAKKQRRAPVQQRNSASESSADTESDSEADRGVDTCPRRESRPRLASTRRANQQSFQDDSVGEGSEEDSGMSDWWPELR
jgi:hypothetical protein